MSKWTIIRSRATTGQSGAVQPDGVTINVSNSSVISVPTATTSVLGLVKPDGTSIIDTAGAISVPTATTSTLGIVKPDGTTILDSAGAISVPTATTSTLGLVKPDGSTILDSAGAISVPTATTSTLGLVKPDGSTITISGGVISSSGGGTTTQSVNLAGTSRALGTVYQNTGTQAIVVAATVNGAGGSMSIVGWTDSSSSPTTDVDYQFSSVNANGSVTFIVVPGNYYKVTTSLTSTLATWFEWTLGSAGIGALTRISQQVLASGASTVTFSSIPSSYTDLQLSYTTRASGSGTSTGISFVVNGDTGTNYEIQSGLINNSFNSAANSSGQTGGGIGPIPAAGATANYAGSGKVNFFNYANTTFFKTMLANVIDFNNTSSGSMQFEEQATLWVNTAAVNSITLNCGSGNFVAGSVFTLYGVA